MRIIVNGAWRELSWEPVAAARDSDSQAGGPAPQLGSQPAAPSLDMVLQRLGFGGARVATALNGQFVPARARGGQRVCEGDRIEVLSPMQGG